jgi:hypothetical protein
MKTRGRGRWRMATSKAPHRANSLVGRYAAGAVNMLNMGRAPENEPASKTVQPPAEHGSSNDYPNQQLSDIRICSETARR